MRHHMDTLNGLPIPVDLILAERGRAPDRWREERDRYIDERERRLDLREGSFRPVSRNDHPATR